MDELNFVTIGENDYFPILNFSIKQIMKFYPNSKFFIYDWGFTPSQRKEIQSYPITYLIDWNKKLDRESGYQALPMRFEGFNPNFDNRKETYLYMQKPYCILDCAKRINKNLIFIDGDAFLINRIDEVLNEDFEIGVTMFPKGRIERYKKIDFILVLSSGVLFFKLKSKKMQFFIIEWIKEMKQIYRMCLEQTALTLLLGKNNPDLFKKHYNEEVINLSDREYKIKILPYDIYNLFILTNGYDAQKVKILHLANFVLNLQKNKERKLSVQVKEVIEEIKFSKIWLKFINLFPKIIRNYIEAIINKKFLKNLLFTHPLNIYWLIKIYNYSVLSIWSILKKKMKIENL